MKGKISEKEKNILYCLIGILLVVIAVSVVFRPMRKKNAELLAQKIELENELATIEDIKAHEEEYLSETGRFKEKSKEISDRFPALVTPQDQILYVVELENRFPTMFVDKLSCEEAVNAQETENGSANANLFCAPMTLDYQIEYTELKGFLNALSEEASRRSIENITLTRDTSGVLIGTMKMDAYYMIGTDKEYEKPDLSDVFTGTENVFKTGGGVSIP